MRRRQLRVECGVKYTPLPPSVHERLKEVTLTADIMFVNASPFFVSLSRKKFGTIETFDLQTVQHDHHEDGDQNGLGHGHLCARSVIGIHHVGSSQDPANDATPVQMHRWKSQEREFEDKTKASP